MILDPFRAGFRTTVIMVFTSTSRSACEPVRLNKGFSLSSDEFIHNLGPQIRQGHPLNLSISLGGGKETN
jgi:hypothetical protein